MSNHVTIIAEAGVNHNGDLKLAFEMVDAAKEAGADYIKFQTFKSENLVTKTATQANYQKKNTGVVESQFDMLKRLELSEEDHFKIVDYCKLKGIKFFSTGFDIDSLNFLQRFNLEIWKIPSGEITNLPYLELIASYKKPVIISTGMANLTEISQAINVFTKYIPKNQITVLHCNTSYPTEMHDVNLLAMNVIRDQFNVAVGYSDHTLGIEVPVAAVALGATVIEKHFTLSRGMTGPDHKCSLEPNELKMMVSSIRNIEKALGKAEKKPTPSESENIAIARKSIVAAVSISKGETFTADMLTTKRPGTGISPMRWYEVIGQKAQRDYSPDEIIE